MSLPPTNLAARNRPVDHDVFCLKCGYNLRTLSPGGRCPECGAPISASLRYHGLLGCGPAYIQKLLRGIRLVSLGVVTYAIALVIMIWDPKESGARVQLLALVPAVIGDFLLSSPSPQLPKLSNKSLFLRASAVFQLAVAGAIGVASLIYFVMPQMYYFEFLLLGIVLIARLNLLRNLLFLSLKPGLRYDASSAMGIWLVCLGAVLLAIFAGSIDLFLLAFTMVFVAVISILAAGLLYFYVLVSAINALRDELHASGILLLSDQPETNGG